MTMMKKKEPWGKFLAKMALVALIIGVAFAWFESRYRIGIDSQIIRCFPDHKYFLVDLKQPEPVRDRIVAYRSSGLQPFFEDGTLMGKIIKGMPGDHITINSDGVFINGEHLADGFPLLDRLDATEESLYRDEIIPDNHYFLMAPAPESYDGRYWGYIKGEQLVGKATPFL